MMRFIKHIIPIIILACSIQFVHAQINYEDTSQKTTSYTVKMGDTAYSIATTHQTTVEEIYKLNPGTDKGVKAGQKIMLPPTARRTSVQVTGTNNNYPTHQIEAKETLYSVAQKYSTTVYDLLRVNPGLSESSFNIGKTINIPTGKPMEIVNAKPSQVDAIFAKSTLLNHQVEKKETLFSISKKYNCSIDEILRLNPDVKKHGLKEGSMIAIPSSSIALTRVDNIDNGVFYPRDGVVRVALLLPFLKGSKNVSAEKIEEYYEGFLLAVQKMKEQGLNAEVYTFDIGTDSDTRRLESILGTNELFDLNLIIGGISDKQVKLISQFSQATGTKYVVPFNNKSTGVKHNINEFQIANSHSNLFPEITNFFVNKFRNDNIIFLTDLGSDNNKKDFVKALQEELNSQGVAYKTTPTTASITNDLNSVLDNSRKNIIVPLSHSESSLKSALDGIDVVSRNNVDISLFGYPEWQVYINTMPRLYRHNTYFYSMFFLDSKSPSAQIFADKYRKWFNKSLLVSYPKFAHMGYDTGILFLTALQKYGHNFSSQINSLGVKSLQTALYFAPVGEIGGYINRGVYIVNMKPDNSIEKIELNK